MLKVFLNAFQVSTSRKLNKNGFLEDIKFYVVVHETDPHARILKENADHFAEYTCLQINKAIHLRCVQIRTFSGPSFPVVGLNTGKY